MHATASRSMDGAPPAHAAPLREDIADVLVAIERAGEVPPEQWQRLLERLEELKDDDVRRLLQALEIALERNHRARHG